MKVIAHRGWSAGKSENTINAFQKAIEKEVDGVEFDVRWSIDKKEVIISHDPGNLETGSLSNGFLRLEEGLSFWVNKEKEILLEMKEFDERLFRKIIELLEKFKLTEKTLIIGFREVAECFDWKGRKVRLGIITRYPWNIKKNIQKYRPDTVLLGWDDRWWTKPFFKSVWSFLSLPRLCKQYPDIHFVVGVVKSEVDYRWVSKQKGLYGFTVDRFGEWK